MEKKPLVNYEGTVKELQPGDTIQAVDQSIDGGAASTVYLVDQSIDGGGA